jgi:hypothetical protein
MGGWFSANADRRSNREQAIALVRFPKLTPLLTPARCGKIPFFLPE